MERREQERLERRLRAARPAVPPLGPEFAAQVMGEIKRQGLVPRPAWQVRGALWLRRGAAVAALLAAAVALNAVVFELRSNGTLELLYFGTGLLGGFVTQLPYDFLLAALLLAGTAAWLLHGADLLRGIPLLRGVPLLGSARLLRVPVAWAVLVSYGLTGAGGLSLAASGLNETVQESVLRESLQGPGLSWFYGERAVYHRPHPRFRMGRVVALADGRARLETPLGEEETVRLPPGFQAQVGDWVRLLTAADGAGLRAEQAQQCNPRRVGPYFQHHRTMREMMQGRGMRGPMGPGMGHMGGGMGPGIGGGMRHMGPPGPAEAERP
jgi:hypothetical protein